MFHGLIGLLQGAIGAFVWAAANYLYIDMRRKGKRGWSRFFLFWMGMPTNWLWLLLVREGREPEFLEAPDDAAALLEEIRRERARELREGAPESSVGPGDTPESN